MVREFVTTSAEAVGKAVAAGAMLRVCERSNAVVVVVAAVVTVVTAAVVAVVTVVVIGYWLQAKPREELCEAVCVCGFSSVKFVKLLG